MNFFEVLLQDQSDNPVLAFAFRELVQEGFPLHEDHIPAILENIGDHEQDVIETILAAVANARRVWVISPKTNCCPVCDTVFDCVPESFGAAEKKKPSPGRESFR